MKLNLEDVDEDDDNQIVEQGDKPSQPANQEDEVKESDAQIYRRKKDNLQKLYSYVLKWTDEIDTQSFVMTMNNKEDQETARSIQNLLERAVENLKDTK